MVRHDVVRCANPDPGKQPVNIPRWKFEVVRAAILEVLTDRPEGVEFKRLPALVGDALADDDLQRLGSVPWHTTVVKLHLEAVSEIERIAGRRPQVIRFVQR